MFPFERPIRDLVLKNLDDDPETLQSLNDKEAYTRALTGYLRMSTRDRDMYRETLDDLMDTLNGKASFSSFPPKYRREGKYYIDYYRKHHPSRWYLYHQRKNILWELKANGVIEFPRWPWQSVTVIDGFMLKRLRSLIAEFEDRCFQSLGKSLTSRLEYNEVKHQLIEHTPRGEITRRNLKPGKLPERFIIALMKHPGKMLTYEKVYGFMGIANKKDRRNARWRDELRLNDTDLRRFFHLIDADRIKFTPEYRYSEAKEA